VRRSSGLLLFLTGLLVAVCFYALPLAAQRRPTANPFPDDDELGAGGYGRYYSISGTVADRQSGLRLDGVRVDLNSFNRGAVATTFTTQGNFRFDDLRDGTYDLTFNLTGYQEVQEHLEVSGPVFGMAVNLKPLNEAPAGSSPTVSVRDLSIPQKARDAMNKGMVLLHQKSDYAGSIKEFERAIKIFPNYYEAHAQIGYAYMAMKDPEHAEEALRQSIVVSQEHYPDAFFLLAALFSSQKRFADAEPLARKGVDLAPDSWHAQSEMAQALLGEDRAEDAEKYAQAAVKLQPDNPLLWLLLANIHGNLQNDPALIEDLDAYLKLAPKSDVADRVRQGRDEAKQRLQQSQASPAVPLAASPAAGPASSSQATQQ
jgi:tetratricopeptide (TPR) repeat protein